MDASKIIGYLAFFLAAFMAVLGFGVLFKFEISFTSIALYISSIIIFVVLIVFAKTISKKSEKSSLDSLGSFGSSSFKPKAEKPKPMPKSPLESGLNKL